MGDGWKEEDMMRFLITGGTGFLGTAFRKEALQRDRSHSFVILSRQSKSSNDAAVTYVKWDGKSIPDEVGQIDVLINFAGANIGTNRWTEENKKTFYNSRIWATEACVDWLKRTPTPPRFFLSGSAVGYYGGFNETIVDEGDPPGDDFMGTLCRDWEKAAEGAPVRTVCIRTGVVITPEDGALKQMLLPFKLGVGGVIGSGEQGFPWIHPDDYIRIMFFLIENEEIEGPVNAVAPQITDNKMFTNALKKVLHRPAFLPVPKFALKLAMGEGSILAWGGQKVVPKKLLQHGFSCTFPEIRPALKDLLD